MSGRGAYVVVRVNTEQIPTELPAWLLTLIDTCAETRDAALDAERAVAVVVRSEDEAKTKAERCSFILNAFVRDHGHRTTDIARDFARMKQGLSPDFARSLGADLGVLIVTCTNLAYRARVLTQLVEAWPERDDPASITLFRCMAEAFPGQGPVLDWIGASLIGPAPVLPGCDA
jgi:hypothetical protein